MRKNSPKVSRDRVCSIVVLERLRIRISDSCFAAFPAPSLQSEAHLTSYISFLSSSLLNNDLSPSVRRPSSSFASQYTDCLAVSLISHTYTQTCQNPYNHLRHRSLRSNWHAYQPKSGLELRHNGKSFAIAQGRCAVYILHTGMSQDEAVRISLRPRRFLLRGFAV